MKTLELMGAVLVVSGTTALLCFLLGDLANATQRGRQARTMGDIRTIATAVESYSIDTTHYPRVESIWELAELVEPTYVKTLPIRDGWGEPFDYWLLTPDTYYLRSSGADRSFQQANLREYIEYPNGGPSR